MPTPGLVVAQTVMAMPGPEASQIIGDGLPFWIASSSLRRIKRMRCCSRSSAAVLIGLLPALKAYEAWSVLRGLQEDQRYVAAKGR